MCIRPTKKGLDSSTKDSSGKVSRMRKEEKQMRPDNLFDVSNHLGKLFRAMTNVLKLLEKKQ